MHDTVEKLNQTLKEYNIVEQLQYLASQNHGQIVFSTSFGLEDQVITDVIAKNNIKISIFTIDTGRLFQETYKTFAATIEKYNIRIKTYAPEAVDIEMLLDTKGPNSFYQSVENRKECCFLRKVKPLQRALLHKKVWVTGLRAAQSEHRQTLSLCEWDSTFQIIKFNPLLNWTMEDLNNYIKEYNVPYNSLHDKGFVSIGCAPCTRAINTGETFRAGRWWWENNTTKECGLHK